MDRLAELFSLSLPAWEIMLRGTVLYLALFVLFRFVARREANPLAITDLLLVVLIADASQNAMAGEYKSITDGLLLVATLSFWDLLIDWLSFRFPRFSRLVAPPPLLLISDGAILHRNLRREFISRQDLQAKLRAEGLESADEVKRAFLESSGEITVIKRHKD